MYVCMYVCSVHICMCVCAYLHGLHTCVCVCVCKTLMSTCFLSCIPTRAMDMFIHADIHAYTRTCIHTCSGGWKTKVALGYMQTNLHTNTYMYAYIQWWLGDEGCAGTRDMCIHADKHTYKHMHVCIESHTYIHTNTCLYTYIQWWLEDEGRTGTRDAHEGRHLYA